MYKIFTWLARRRDEALAFRQLNKLSDHLLLDVGLERYNIRQTVSTLVSARYDGVTRDVATLGSDAVDAEAPTVQSAVRAAGGAA